MHTFAPGRILALSLLAAGMVAHAQEPAAPSGDAVRAQVAGSRKAETDARPATMVMGAAGTDAAVPAVVVAPPYPRAIVLNGPLAVATGVTPQTELTASPLPPLEPASARAPSR